MFGIFRLAKRCSDLEDEVRQLKSELKNLQLEWESVYDSLRRLAGKIARRQQHDAQREQEAAEHHEGITPLADARSAAIRAARRSGGLS